MPGVDGGTPYRAADLERFATELLVQVGVPPDDAALTAGSLIEANLRGVDTHGVTRVLVPYIQRLQAGVTNAKTAVDIVQDAPGAALIDGKNGIGQVVAARAMRLAIEKARQTGTAWVGVTHSNHFGTAAFYSLMAVEQDMVGIVMTNGIASVAPTGGRAAMLSTNPISFALPAGKEPPVVVDMATSVVARGRIMLYDKQGLPLPEGWALDDNGRPTTDAAAALRGTLLPFGGYKGYALSLVIDLLCGVMTGALFGSHFHGALADDMVHPMDVGHLFGVIDPARFLPLPLFKERMDQALSELRACPPADGSRGVLIPGDIERMERERRLGEGIPLPEAVIVDFRRLGDQLGVAMPSALDRVG